MNRTLSLGAALLVAVMLASTPAFAQYANEFSLAKVKKQGTTSQPIAGSGEVEIQVQVNADGTHKVIRIIHSTNPGDNAAAMELAQTATYSPAHRGTKPQTSFYDYTLKFNGKTLGGGGASDSESAKVDALIHAGKYADAVSEANSGLAASPGNTRLQELLGIAQYYSKDQVAAAQSFDKVPSISKDFSQVAASAYAEAAVKVVQQDPAQSLAFAKKGLQYNTGANNQFALGVAQVANKNFADAVTTLKPLAADPKVMDKQVKMGIDRQLLNAYLGMGDSSNASAVAAEMKELDPSGDSSAVAMGNYYLSQANTAMQAKDYATALKAYDQASNSTDSQVAVTGNTGAAFAVMQGAKPDYKKAEGYAVKAVQGSPNDAQANYAAGLAYAGLYLTVSHSDGDKQSALAYLKKADDSAKAAGNATLATNIEKQIQAVQQNGQ